MVFFVCWPFFAELKRNVLPDGLVSDRSPDFPLRFSFFEVFEPFPPSERTSVRYPGVVSDED